MSGNPIFSTLDFHGQALTLRSQRQTAIASNIANVDTPGYQARDFNFARELDRASQGKASRDGGGSTGNVPALAATTTAHPGHAGHLPLQGQASQVSTARMQFRQPEQASIDGNTVDLDRERAVFADNTVHYEATLRFINGHVRTMMSAIKGE